MKVPQSRLFASHRAEDWTQMGVKAISPWENCEADGGHVNQEKFSLSVRNIEREI